MPFKCFSLAESKINPKLQVTNSIQNQGLINTNGKQLVTDRNVKFEFKVNLTKLVSKINKNMYETSSARM